MLTFPSIQPYKLWTLPTLSGVLLSLSTATFDIGLFAWIGLVPLLFFLGHRETTARKALIGGLVAGTIYGIAVLWPLSSLEAWWWVTPNSFWFIHREVLLALVLGVVAIISGGGFFCLFSLLYWKFHQNAFADIVAFSLLWMVFERGREVLVYGFTWGHLGYNVHDYTFALQPAQLFGVYAVSGIVVAVNLLVYLVIHRSDARVLYAALLVGFVLILTVGGYVSIRADKNSTSGAARVAVVHSPLTTAESASFDAYESQLAVLEDALSANPDIVVLPENVFPFFVLNQETGLPHKYSFTEVPIGVMFDRLAALSAAHPDTAIALGLHTSDGAKRFNSFVVMEKGVVSGMYSKRVLLPLAERVPERFSKNHVSPITQGSVTQLVMQDGISITPLVCSEIIYPRAATGTTGDILVNISNDGVFESRFVARQHHIIAKLRAVERGAYLLRSTKQGISSIVDPFGRTVKATDTDVHVILNVSIHY